MMDILIYMLAFFIYSFIGWAAESLKVSIEEKRFVDRGFLVGPVCPIYGFGGLLITILLSKYYDDPIVMFFMSMIICGILEYFTSYVMEKIFKARWWDYSDKKYNINGRICLNNLFLFGIASILVVYILNPLVFGILRSAHGIVIIIACIICGLIFLADFSLSAVIIKNLKKVSNEIKDNTEELSMMVNRIIHSKSLVYRRIVIAFPDITEIVSFDKWEIYKSKKKHSKKKKK